MKYCRICGKALSDDAVFCTACGQQCREEEAVTVQPVYHPAEQPAQQQPVYQQPVYQAYGAVAPTENPALQQKPGKSRKLWIAIAAVLVLAIGLGVFYLSGGFVRRMAFPSPATEENFEEFWTVVLKNSGEDCEIVTIDESRAYFVPSGTSLEEAMYDGSVLCVMSRDFVNGRIQMKEGHISVDIRSSFPLPEKDSLQEGKALYDRTRNIIIAFEKTISGQSRAGKFLKSYSKMQNQISEFERDQDGMWETEEETYMLNDKWEVNIMISRTTRDWYLSYYIRIIP